MLEIDGKTLEGGGQLVRVALALSAIRRTSLHIYNIRANRGSKGNSPSTSNRSRKEVSSKSSKHNRSGKSDAAAVQRSEGAGLKESHLAALNWLAEQCDAEVEGNSVGSSEVIFVPSKKCNSITEQHISPLDQQEKHVHTIELERPGSVWLIFQAIYPYIIFGHFPERSISKDNTVNLTLKGGTNVSHSMSSEYVQQVFLPICERISLPKVEVEVTNRGWAGNTAEVGEVKIRAHLPRPPNATDHEDKSFSLPAFFLNERGPISKFVLTVIADPEETRDEIISKVTSLLTLPQTSINSTLYSPDTPIEIHSSTGPSYSRRRLSLLLVAHTVDNHLLASSHLGSGRLAKSITEHTKIIQQASEELVREMIRQLRRGGCVDEYMQDQLVIFQALACGRSQIDSGRWVEGGDGRKRHVLGVEVGDEEGSLHTRTVRWVCESMLRRDGVVFDGGGFCNGIAQGSDVGDLQGMAALDITDADTAAEGVAGE